MTNTTNPARNAVFVAAKAQGKSTQVVVDAIKACKVDWNDAKAVSIVAEAYKAGRIVASLNLKSEIAALAILALKPHKDGANDGHRTFSQHLACRAAISAWSTIRLLAGAPSSQTGAKRAPRPAQTTVKAADAIKLPDNLLPAIMRAKSEADVHAYALRIAGNVAKYVNLNSRFVKGDVGSILRAFATDCAKVAKEPVKELPKAA